MNILHNQPISCMSPPTILFISLPMAGVSIISDCCFGFVGGNIVHVVTVQFKLFVYNSINNKSHTQVIIDH